VIPDRLNHLVGASEHIVVPEAKYGIAIPIQKGRSAIITRQSFWLVVLTAINLNNELPFETSKVDDVGTDAVLPAEMNAKPVTAKPAPESFLGFRHIAP